MRRTPRLKIAESGRRPGAAFALRQPLQSTMSNPLATLLDEREAPEA
jgi:hypothetical protein